MLGDMPLLPTLFVSAFRYEKRLADHGPVKDAAEVSWVDK
jgi:hypothetical protein